MATLYDVCEKTGLSTATVSRVINGSGLVKEETRERVLQAMRELDYHPSHAARMLAGRKTDTIGVILPLLDNGYYVQVLRGIDEVSTKENLKLMISFYHSESDMLDILSSLGREKRTDAMIVMNNPYFGAEKVRELAGPDIPVALIGQTHGPIKAVDSVLIDNFQGAYSAVEHLMKTKPRSLVLMTGPKDNHDSDERFKGAQKAIQDSGHEPEVTTLTGDYYHEGGRNLFAAHVEQSGSFPEAVFAFNDAMALGVLDVLSEHGKKVPEDVQVVGFDNTEIGQYIGLSSVNFPMMQIGEEAARLVFERIQDNTAKQVTLTMPTTLVARKTTA